MRQSDQVSYEVFEPAEVSAPPPSSSTPNGYSRRPAAEMNNMPSFVFSSKPMQRHVDPSNNTMSSQGHAVDANAHSFVENFSAVLNAPLPFSLRDSPYGKPSSRREGPVNVSFRGPTMQTPRKITPPRRTVHDALYEEGKIIRQYKEALQEEAVRRELSSLKKPRISRYAIERDELRTHRGARQDVVVRMEERVRAAREKRQIRADEIRAQRARQDELMLAEGDDDSFAESLDFEDDLHNEGRKRGADDDHKSVKSRQSIVDDSHLVSGRVSRSRSIVSHKKRTNSAPATPRTPFQPRLTGKGRRAVSKVMAPDFLTGWKHRQDQKVDHRKTETILKEVEGCQETPGITRRSRILAAKANARDGLSSLPPLEAMLERDRLRKLAQWERRQAQEAEANLFHPRITLYAATLGSESLPVEEPDTGAFNVASITSTQRAQMPVSERLYADAFAQEERRVATIRKMKDDMAAAQKAASQVHRNASRSASPARQVPVVESLLDRHAKLRAEQKLKLEQMKLAESLLHQPVINPVSEAITSRLPHTSADRLTSGHRSIFERPVYRSTEQEHLVLSKVLSREEEHLFALKLAGYEEKRRETLRRLEYTRASEQMSECTFAPIVSKKSEHTSSSAGVDLAPPSELEQYYALKHARLEARDSATQQASRAESHSALRAEQGEAIEERTNKWLQRRDAKLEALREESARRRDEEEMRLSASQTRDSLSAARSSSVNGAETIYAGGKPWGTDEHIQRQLASRKIREEREERLSGKPKQSAVNYKGPVPTVALANSVRRSLSSAPLRGASAEMDTSRDVHSRAQSPAPVSLHPPVAPADVREALSLGPEDIRSAYESPSMETMQSQQRAYEQYLAQPAARFGGQRDTYIEMHSMGILKPPSLW